MEFKTRVLVPGRFSREETVSTGESRKTERKKKTTPFLAYLYATSISFQIKYHL